MPRGGKRAGAGRKKTGRNRDAPHRTRPELSSRHPVHVVWRVSKRFLRLRTGRTYDVIRRVLKLYLGLAEFRVVHASIQHNHLHFLVEAKDRAALTSYLQSLGGRLARAINADLGRCGKVFVYRYHATQITTARHARNAISYVLNNWRRHREDWADKRAWDAKLDPYASGVSFAGWNRCRFKIPDGYDPLPVSAPRTSLLRDDWQRFGLIDVFEKPGPLWS